MTRALFPGTFDPLTLGHQDLIQRAARLFDEVIVAIAMSPGKRPLFELEERVALARAVCAQWPNVRVDGFSGLLVDHLRQTGANVLLRGVRSLSDFDYEQQLVGMYRRMVPDLEILYMPTAAELAFISSTLVREVALHGGDVACFVPPSVAEAVRARIAGDHSA
ncbi:pantetheine-phosphate adenylyltransferase [Pseudaeromonas sp. ZJS20]|uniref:pantetheine-phosphate adenylyltransferase n=1 Tax=Pseudaeromonas aegiceratis TaxID=3153928 RepID=UPI00390C88D5